MRLRESVGLRERHDEMWNKENKQIKWLCIVHVNPVALFLGEVMEFSLEFVAT